ncbi:MAG: hypothetical protein HY927_01465 [Elusimicrobia bacterium]|nr:hypothetical protein [Elusimicrobiota bacterium]
MILVILGFMSASIIQLTLGRRGFVARVNDSARARLAAHSAEHQAAACLYDTGFGRDGCSLAQAAACLPRTVSGYGVSFEASGSPPSCQLAIRVTR